MIDPPVRAMLADDEPIARAALRRHIAGVPWLECAGEATNGRATVAMVAERRPELLFLDVRMPGLNGIEVLERISRDLVVVFTTAYDDYALTAFELGAIDYLRKPFGQARFLTSVERAVPQFEALRRRTAAPGASGVAGAAGATIRERLEFASANERPLQRLFIRDRGVAVPVRVDDITRFEADGDYVAVLSRGRRQLVYVNLGELASQLDPARFVRVHRSHIVNLDAVASVAPLDGGRAELRLADGTRIEASRAGNRLLRTAMTGVVRSGQVR